MCDHKWIPLELEGICPVDVGTGTIYLSHTSGYRVTKVICAECGEKKKIAESPRDEANRLIREYEEEK